MTPERWRQVCALLAAALRCAPAEREVLLREVGAGHPELQTEVDRLLAGDARADEEGFLRGNSGVLQPIMPLDLPVKVRPWELTVYPRSHIRR